MAAWQYATVPSLLRCIRAAMSSATRTVVAFAPFRTPAATIQRTAFIQSRRVRTRRDAVPLTHWSDFDVIRVNGNRRVLWDVLGSAT
ncbi:hypothetical protein ACWCQM_18670 [Streptomyces sp. NPDC002125]